MIEKPSEDKDLPQWVKLVLRYVKARDSKRTGSEIRD
jgi:hypothetical protein